MNKRKNIFQDKKIRNSNESVKNRLFEAFGKHQYFRLVDLEKMTKEPVVNQMRSL